MTEICYFILEVVSAMNLYKIAEQIGDMLDNMDATGKSTAEFQRILRQFEGALGGGSIKKVPNYPSGDQSIFSNILRFQHYTNY